MSNFYFCKNSPSNSMYSDIGKLDNFNEDQSTELQQIIFELLKDPSKSSTVIDDVESFASQNGLPAPAVKNIFKSVLAVAEGAIKYGISENELSGDLQKLGLEQDKAVRFSQKFSSEKSVFSSSNRKAMVNQLVDMEWKFGVCAASSESTKVGNTFIQMKLVVNKGSGKENVHMELSVPQFYSFLQEMESVKSSLEQLV